jgi:DNA repair protein RadD
MLQPRDYQADAIARSVHFLTKGKPDSGGGLVVLPTGAGKSIVIAGVVQALDGPCLIFQPTKEILEQNANKLLAYGYDPKVYSASMGTKEIGDITLATIGSVKDNPGLFDHVPYVIVDEAHLVNAKAGMYQQFIEAMGAVRVLGLTATPFRLHTDGYGGSQLKFLTRTRPRVFGEVVAYAQVGDLIDAGYLVKPEYQIVSGFKTADLKVNTTGADYTDESIKRYFNRIGFNDRVKRVVLRLLEVGRKNVLVFTRFVEDADRLASEVAGTAVVTSDTKPKVRAAIIAAFRAGEIKVVANVGVLGIGFDYPELETVVLARPTISLALYYQQVGRLLRPHPAKTSAWVVDMVDQVGQFGRIEDLWLQPGGTSSYGALWEMVSKSNGATKVLTNRYFGDGKFKRRRP